MKNSIKGIAPIIIIPIVVGVLILAVGGYFILRYVSFSDSSLCRQIRFVKMIDTSHVCSESAGSYKDQPAIVVSFEGPGYPVEGGGKIVDVRVFYLDPITKSITVEAFAN